MKTTLVRRARLVASLALFTLPLSHCMLLSGKCIYETRAIEGAGRIDDAGTELVSGRVNFSETRDGMVDKFMYWILTGATLKPHVTSAQFKSSSNPSRVLLDLPLASADRTPISESGVDENEADLTGFFELIASGGAVIELRTDLPQRPTITIPLAPGNRQDWIRPNCS